MKMSEIDDFSKENVYRVVISGRISLNNKE